MFKQWLENTESDLRSFLLDAAHGICEKIPTNIMNCRLFAQLVIDQEIEDLPEVKDMRVGDVLVWGNMSSDGGKPYFNWGHVAIYLGNDEVVEVPGYGKPMQIKKKWKSELLRAKIFRPYWEHKSIKTEATEYLPAILYHVTTAGREIDQHGFMSANAHGKGTMLGGGFSEAVSFTDNLEWAKLYKKALEVTQLLLYENLISNKHKLLLELQPFKINWEKFEQQQVERYVNSKNVEMFLFMLPAITEGRFPHIFGSGLKERLLPDSDVSILHVSTLPGNGKPGPQKWTTNPKEKEYRIYDPENFDNQSIDYVG